MVYVALLRGINVGGNRKVEMARLKLLFERLGFRHIKTFIASGNVIFVSDEQDQAKLAKQIEVAIEHEFGFPLTVLLHDLPDIAKLVKALPAAWVNDAKTKCDIMFLQPEIDSPDILEQISHKPEIEDVLYVPGAIVWRIDRDKVTRGAVLKLNTSELYQRMTIRNSNTVRKLYELMLAAEES